MWLSLTEFKKNINCELNQCYCNAEIIFSLLNKNASRMRTNCYSGHNQMSVPGAGVFAFGLGGGKVSASGSRVGQWCLTLLPGVSATPSPHP